MRNSIATLHNPAFLISEYTIDENYTYTTNGYKIENSILKQAISTKSAKRFTKTGKKPLIIFPYHLSANGYKRYSEDEMISLFPFATKYLKTFEDQLNKRKANTGTKWFEYGRSQALNELYGKKLVLPMVITKKVETYLADEMTIPYAGYFVKSKKNSKFGLAFAKKLLESPAFYNFVKSHGTPTTKTSYRISVKEIENYQFDPTDL